MKKYIWMLVFFVTVIFMSQNSNSIAYAQESDGNRVIYVLYDNSSSMTFDSKNKKIFHTYWVEADYAIRALVASRKDNDIIYIFPMNSEQDEAIEVNKFEDVDEVSRCFFSNTPFASIGKAVQALEETAGPGDEKWLLIFTDGEFFKPGFPLVKAAEDELKDRLNSIDSDINILYLPIGSSGVTKVSADALNSNIQQISSDDSVLQQILVGCNMIYRRNELEPIQSGKSVRYHIDAPIKELIVFLQEEGEEYLLNKRTDGGQDAKESQESCTSKMEEFESSIISKLPVAKKKTVDIQSYCADIPDYKGGEMTLTQFHEGLKTKDIFGKMVKFEKTEAGGQESYEFDYEFKLSGENGAKKEKVALYYNLDLGFEVEITQDGTPLYNWKLPSKDFWRIQAGKTADTNTTIPIEPDNLEIPEGTYEITVYPTTSDGKQRIPSDAVLLQKVTLEVNQAPSVFGQPIPGHAEYEQPVSLAVTMKGGGMMEEFSLEKELQVTRRLYPLIMELDKRGFPEYFDYGMMEAGKDGISEKGSYFTVAVKEDKPEGILEVRSGLLEDIELQGTISYKDMKKNETPGIGVRIEAAEGSGSYRVYPYLFDPKDENTYEDVVCHLTSFYRELPGDLVGGESEAEQEHITGTLDVELPLRAEAQKLEVQIKKAPEYTIGKFMKEGVGLEIMCGGSLLPHDAKIELKSLEGDESHQLLSRNRIKAMFQVPYHYFFYGKDEIAVQKEITFLRRGVPCVGTVNDVLAYRPVPLQIRLAVFLLMLLVALWLLLFATFWLTDVSFGITFCPLLTIETPDGNSDTCKIKKKVFPLLTGLGRQIKLIVREEFLSREDFPELCIRKRGRTSFIIINYEDFQGRDITVNGERITQYTQVDYDGIMRGVDSNGVSYTIRFTKNIGEEV